MGMLKREIRFWSRYYRDMVLVILCIGLAGLFYIGLRMGNYAGIEEILQEMLLLVPIYWMLGGGILLSGSGGNFYKSAVPLSLSMGNTRKMAITGMNLTYGAACVTFTVLTGVITLVTPGASMKEMMWWLPGVAGIYLAEGALGIIVGTIYSFWGKWGVLIIAIVSGGFGASLGITMGMVEEQKIRMFDLVGVIRYPWLIFAAGFVLFAAAAVINQVTHRKIEVCL